MKSRFSPCESSRRRMWLFIYRCKNNFSARIRSRLAQSHPGLPAGAQCQVIHRGTQQSARTTQSCHAPSIPGSTLPSSVEDFVAQALTLADEAGGFGLICRPKCLTKYLIPRPERRSFSKGLNAALDLGNGFFPSITENAALLTGTLNSTDTNIQWASWMPIVVQ